MGPIEAIAEVPVVHLVDGLPGGDAPAVATDHGRHPAADGFLLRAEGEMAEPGWDAADPAPVERKALNAHVVLLGEVHDPVQRRPVEYSRFILHPAPEAGERGGLAGL